MARRKTLIKDIVASPLALRRTVNVMLTPETERALHDLANRLASHRNFDQQTPRPMNKRESDSAFQAWIPTAPRPIQRTAAEISLSMSRDNALEYLRSEFYKARPECVPNRKQGRPEWYIPRATRDKLLQGEVISMLINSAGNKLFDELGEQQRVA